MLQRNPNHTGGSSIRFLMGIWIGAALLFLEVELSFSLEVPHILVELSCLPIAVFHFLLRFHERVISLWEVRHPYKFLVSFEVVIVSFYHILTFDGYTEFLSVSKLGGTRSLEVSFIDQSI